VIQSAGRGPILGTDWRQLAPTLSQALARGIRNAVLDGQLRPAEPLPAERRLAAQLGLSRGTVVAAYSRLRAEGWLTTRHGSGSAIRLPATLRVRYAPLSIDQPGALLDLRRAVPAAPHGIFVASVHSALARSSGLLLEDGEPGPGLPRLRELIAARFTGEQLATSPQQILITAGARAAMSLLAAHLRPRAAIVESPTFFGILSILRQSASRISSIAVSSQGGWNPRHIDDAFSGLNGGIAMLVPDFHNPTAAVMSWEARKEIAERARSARVTIIANEVMRDLDLRDSPEPVRRIPGAIIVGSMSKTVWAGLRVGWLRGPASLIRELQLDPLCVACAPPPLEQLIACELLPQLAPLTGQRIGELRRQRDYLVNALREEGSWDFSIPQGGLWLWMRHARVSGDALATRASDYGLALLSGSRFSLDGTLGNWLRFPFTAPVPTLCRALNLLRRAVAAMET
jgi:DNA-binding transcriptional MocR family regulator